MTKIEVAFAKNLPGFTDNRARITLADSGNRISPEEWQKPAFPFPCNCLLRKGTIHITAAFGLRTGLGLQAAIHKSLFAARFFHEADGANIFKRQKTDTASVDRISAAAQEQSPVLLHRPSFAGNETIAGTFEGRFKAFYELDLGKS